MSHPHQQQQQQKQLSKQKLIQDKALSYNTTGVVLSALECYANRFQKDKTKRTNIFSAYNNFDCGSTKTNEQLKQQIICQLTIMHFSHVLFVREHGKYEFPKKLSQEQMVQYIKMWGSWVKDEDKKYYASAIAVIEGKDPESFISELEGDDGKINPNWFISNVGVIYEANQVGNDAVKEYNEKGIEPDMELNSEKVGKEKINKTAGSDYIRRADQEIMDGMFDVVVERIEQDGKEKKKGKIPENTGGKKDEQKAKEHKKEQPKEKGKTKEEGKTKEKGKHKQEQHEDKGKTKEKGKHENKEKDHKKEQPKEEGKHKQEQLKEKEQANQEVKVQKEEKTNQEDKPETKPKEETKPNKEETKPEEGDEIPKQNKNKHKKEEESQKDNNQKQPADHHHCHDCCSHDNPNPLPEDPKKLKQQLKHRNEHILSEFKQKSSLQELLESFGTELQIFKSKYTFYRYKDNSKLHTERCAKLSAYLQLHPIEHSNTLLEELNLDTSSQQ